MKGDLNTTSRYRFDEFILDVPNRQLWQGDTAVELKSRYLDALILLVREPNQLIDKDRFFEEVWGGVVVSDSALTQCIKEIRKHLDDDASNPRYIQTIPRHGYRFIGVVEELGKSSSSKMLSNTADASTMGQKPYSLDSTPLGREPVWIRFLFEWGAGSFGGAFAGLLGGLLYGFGLSSSDAGIGTLSTLFVLMSLNIIVGFAGATGISFGLATASVIGQWSRKMRAFVLVLGGAIGGLLVGSTVKLLGVDAFNLLFGTAPNDITGGGEGMALGAAIAIGAILGSLYGPRIGWGTNWGSVAGAGLAGATTGALIPLSGGRLMGGSLALLADSFSESRLELDRFGPVFGQIEFGNTTQVILGSIEGLLLATCVVGALVVVENLRTGHTKRWI